MKNGRADCLTNQAINPGKMLIAQKVFISYASADRDSR